MLCIQVPRLSKALMELCDLCLIYCMFGWQAEKVHELNEEIGKLLAKAEQLGAEGNVDEAQTVLQEVEKVRTKKKDAEVLFICKLSHVTDSKCDVTLLNFLQSYLSLTLV